MSIGAPRSCAEIAPLGDRLDELAALAETGAANLVACDVSILGDADVATIDALARLQLAALDLHCKVWLQGASPELKDLLEFAGLDDAIPCLAESALEARRQAEHREEARGIEEERDPADLVT